MTGGTSPLHRGLSRRRLLAAAPVAGLAALAAGCGRRGKPADPDLTAAAMVAGVERVAIDTYETVRRLFTDGELGAKLPDVLVSFVITGADHHHQALAAWNNLRIAAGRPAVNSPHAELKLAVDTAVTALTDVVAAARLALRLEDFTSQTYLMVIPTLADPAALTLAAQLFVVDQQHQAVLRYLLGLYPVGSGTLRDAGDFAPADPRPSLVSG